MVDTNLLLSHPDTFRLIVSTKDWSVVIPNCGMLWRTEFSYAQGIADTS